MRLRHQLSGELVAAQGRHQGKNVILLRSSANVLLEGVPASGKASPTVHVACAAGVDDWQDLLQRIRARVAQRFDLHHSTVRIERTPCEQAHEPDAATFSPDNAT
jgi:hypothetical protein